MIKTVAIVSLSAGTLGEDFVRHELELGRARLEAMGLAVKFAPHALMGRAYLAAHPEARAADLLWAFRDRETAAARQAAALDNTVIATGGGIVLRPENMEALAATGMIFFRDRDLEDILGEDHMGRPLVGKDPEKLRILYTQRIELYRKYAQYIISNTKTAEEAAARIAALYREACQP